MPARKIIIMYHSVSSAACPGVTGSVPIPMARFARQIEQLHDAGFRFGKISQLDQTVDRDTVYITSDDGTIDWALNALPWCEAHGIPTYTSIITGPWRVPAIYPVAHQLQIMLAAGLTSLPMPGLTTEQRDYIDRIYAYETHPVRRRLKGACNLILSDTEARGLLGEPDPAMRHLLSRRFAPAEAYADLTLAEFGPHTVSHRAFDGYVDDYLAREITPCVAALREAGLGTSRCFALPMRPRYPATTEQLADALEHAGFRFVMEGLGFWDGRSRIVPRIDAATLETNLGLAPWKEPAAASAA
ncbi:MAG: polysaccharide deacetylase family protein [Phycisphaeraceae bacterium]|nr:polysaccharide deacetylase family protein [Phycisphaeraceae bacterium]